MAWKFQQGDLGFTRNYGEGLIWVPVVVLRATGPIFYEIIDASAESSRGMSTERGNVGRSKCRDRTKLIHLVLPAQVQKQSSPGVETAATAEQSAASCPTSLVILSNPSTASGTESTVTVKAPTRG